MGRGRAKAKQTKVARKLKYRTIEPDLNALKQELLGDQYEPDVEDDPIPDAYADLARKYGVYDDDHEGSSHTG